MEASPAQDMLMLKWTAVNAPGHISTEDERRAIGLAHKIWQVVLHSNWHPTENVDISPVHFENRHGVACFDVDLRAAITDKAFHMVSINDVEYLGRRIGMMTHHKIGWRHISHEGRAYYVVMDFSFTSLPQPELIDLVHQWAKPC
jgi:hypothetical protein